MAPHTHEWETLHVVYPDPKADVAVGEVGREHDEPYKAEFCGGCGTKRTKLLSKAEATQLGIRLGRIVADELDLVARNAS